MATQAPPIHDPESSAHGAVKARPLFDPPIVKRAHRGELPQARPAHPVKNPVMFVVEVVSVIVTVR